MTMGDTVVYLRIMMRAAIVSEQLTIDSASSIRGPFLDHFFFCVVVAALPHICCMLTPLFATDRRRFKSVRTSW